MRRHPLRLPRDNRDRERSTVVRSTKLHSHGCLINLPSGRDRVCDGMRHVSPARCRFGSRPRRFWRGPADGVHFDRSRIRAEVDQRQLRSPVRSMRHRLPCGLFDHSPARAEFEKGGTVLAKSDQDPIGGLMSKSRVDKEKMALTIKAKESCRWDLVSLGEVMLRFDPGGRRIWTTRSFEV